MTNLKDRTLFITGASRGIGLAIALRAARDGANVVVAAKTDAPHPKLAGTVHTACDEIRAAGGQALACVLDVRDEAEVALALEQARAHFGGVDILINNASAISLTPAQATPMSRFDLMHQVNARATFLCSKLAYELLRRGTNPHILTLSPPLNVAPQWFAPHVAYSLSKFGMSLCTLGLAGEYAEAGIAVNSLWPKTMIATAAVSHLLGADGIRHCRRPEIVADAAHRILTTASRSLTGQFLVDEDVLRGAGVTDFDQYAVEPGVPPAPDIFL